MADQNKGLDFTIRIRDEFSSAIKQFKDQVAAAKGALDSIKSSSGAFREVSAQLRQNNTAERQAAQEKRNQDREAKAAAQEELKRLRLLNATIKERDQIQKTLGRAEVQRKKDEAKEAKRLADLAAQQAKAEAAAAEARKKAADAAVPPIQRLGAQFGKLSQTIFGANNQANRLLFSLRNIIGIGAGIVLFQQITRNFTALVKEGVDFNATLEQTSARFAAILEATFALHDGQGRLVTDQNSFAVAMTKSQRVIASLRQTALGTGTSFEVLSEAFQVAADNADQTDLSIGQILITVKKLAQAAAVKGLSEDKLGQEIRAILTSSVTARTAPLAKSLGLDKAAIDRAKGEAGGLFRLLEQRLSGFAKGEELISRTFKGTTEEIQAILRELSAASASPLFDALRTTFTELLGLLRMTDKAGNLIPRPELVAALTPVFEGLRDAVLGVKGAVASITFDELRNGARGLGDVFRLIGQAIGGIVRGLVSGLSLVGRLSAGIKRALGFIDPSALAVVTGELAKWGTLVLAASLAFTGLKFLISPIFALIGALLAPTAAFLKTIGLVPGVFFKWIGAIGLIVLALQKVAEATLGVEVGIKDLPEFLGAIIEQVFTKIIGLGDVIATVITVRSKQAFNSFLATAENALTRVKGLFDLELGASDELKRLNAREREMEIAGRNNKTTAENKQLELEITEAKRRSAQIAEDADRNAGQRLANLRAQIENFPQVDATPTVDVEGTKEKLAQVQEALDNIQPFAVLDDAPKGKVHEFGDMFAEMGKALDAELRLARSAVENFSSFVADSIVDAFDPTNKTSLKERFARFLQDIAKMTIAELTKIAIVRAILGLGLATPTVGASDGGSVPSVPAFATGGPVPEPHPRHYGIKAPRPRNVPVSDTVPAWLTPGEFVLPVAAVRAYGADLLEALRRRIIDPLSLRSAAGVSGRYRTHKARVLRGMGMAAGGPVGAFAQGAAAAAVASAPAQDSRPQVLPVLIAEPRQADRIISAGWPAIFQHLKDNAPQVNAALGRRSPF